ncbi:MAG TPA: LLM class flavin-dependent oxidoreductase [Actinomycetota bacterium]|nr:LLM class flavin-dependent oxidoreductase [Actinomycetota bacterium]
MTEPGREALRVGAVVRDPLPWPELREVVETVDLTGYEAVFVPEIDAREAFATLAGFAVVTSRVRLGTGVVDLRSRSPAAVAMAAATLQELSGGRLVLGLGSGSLPPGRETLETVRAYVATVRAALAGETVRAERFGVPRFRLDLEPLPPPPPIWLGALGDRMLEVAARVADGAILNWCTPERAARARRVLDRAARQAGRDPSRLTLAVYVRCCLGVAERVAMESLREMTGRYAALPQYLRQFEAMGLGEEARLAAKAFAEGRPQDVPETLVRAVAVTGGRREAMERFEQFRRAGADVVFCYPVATLDRFSSVLGTLMAAAPNPAVER